MTSCIFVLFFQVCQRNVAVPSSVFSLGSIQSVAYDISGSVPSSNEWLIVATYSMGDATATLNRYVHDRSLQRLSFL